MKQIKPNTPCLVKTNDEYKYLNGSVVVVLEKFDLFGHSCWSITPMLPNLDGDITLSGVLERALIPLDNPGDDELDIHSMRNPCKDYI